MIKRLVWKENDVYFVSVTEDTSTVIQLLKKPFVLIFNDFRENTVDSWTDIDLNEIEEFRVIRVLHCGVKWAAQEKIKEGITPVKQVVLPTVFIKKDYRKWLNTSETSYNLVYNDPEIGDRGMDSEILEEDILERKTWEEIEEYELSNYHVDFDFMRRIYLASTIRFNIDPWKYFFLKDEDNLPAKSYEEFVSMGGFPYREKSENQ